MLFRWDQSSFLVHTPAKLNLFLEVLNKRPDGFHELETVMVMLGIPFVFRSVRSGSVGSTLFLGIMLGLTFFAMAKGFGFLVPIYGIPPLAGAFVPLLVFLGIAIGMLRKVA